MAVFRPFVERRTYRELLFLLSGVPIAAAWFGLLLTGWLATLLLAVTPLLVPVLVAFRAATWLSAAAEAAIARQLLGVRVEVPQPALGGRGYWGRIRGILSDARFWREQTYLFLRTVVGFGTGIAAVSAVGGSLSLIATPITYRWSDESWGSWKIDTLSRSFVLCAIGCVGLVVSVHLVRVLAAFWAKLAPALLDWSGRGQLEGEAAIAFRRGLPFHAAFFVCLNALVVLIWALTTHAYFWPMWTLLPLGLLLAVHAWVVVASDTLRERLGLAIHAGIAVGLALFLVGVWAVTTRAYFWPVWPMLGLAIVVGIHVLAVAAPWRDRAALNERIDVLTTTRAGAVDVAESELRRIERDLHDGAQARLVALGMSLGMAEQKLASDPNAARELLAEARAGAGEALKELRDLARGIHPPVLVDRGLGAALAALTARSPLPVDVSVDVAERPSEPVETAAYFVVAEALTNAAKHARASRIEIHIARADDTLTIEVVDNGVGGAEPAGPGLTGIRRRVEALDGSLEITSPAGGPTTVKAVLPCAS